MNFDSKQYAWSDVEIWLLGKKVVGARAVKYKIAHEKEAVYGAGNEPQSISRGNKSYTGEITLLQSEVEALTATAIASGGNDITDLSAMNVVVAYAPKGGAKTVDMLLNIEFSDIEKGLKQNDKFAEITLPFIALGITKNV